MPFDPLSWLIGFGLTQTSKPILDNLFSKELPDKLYKVAHTWVRQLPLELQFDPTSLFTLYSTNELNSENARINKMLREFAIPSTDIWFEALAVNWLNVKKRLRSESVQFYKIDENIAEKYLRVLSDALELECKKDNELFKVTVISKLDDIKNLVTLFVPSTGLSNDEPANRVLLTTPGFMRRCKIDGRKGMALDFSSMEFIFSELISNSITEIVVPANSLTAMSAQHIPPIFEKYVRPIDAEGICLAIRDGLMASIGAEFGFKGNDSSTMLIKNISEKQELFNAFSTLFFNLYDYLLACKYKCQIDIHLENLIEATNLLRLETKNSTSRTNLSIIEGLFRCYEKTSINAVKPKANLLHFADIAENAYYLQLSKTTATFGLPINRKNSLEDARMLSKKLLHEKKIGDNLDETIVQYSSVRSDSPTIKMLDELKFLYLPPVTTISKLLNNARVFWEKAKPEFIAPSNRSEYKVID